MDLFSCELLKKDVSELSSTCNCIHFYLWVYQQYFDNLYCACFLYSVLDMSHNFLFNFDDRQARSPVKGLSNPHIVNSYLGIFSTIEILAVLLFILFLTWTFYAHVSNDFKKFMPVKNLKLNMWVITFILIPIIP